jgi:nonribosomal peptide synthetase CepB
MTEQQIAIEDILNVTPCQKLFLDFAAQDSVATMNLQQYQYLVGGNIDQQMAFAAWQAVVDAHPALRSSLHSVSVSQPYQVIHKQAMLPFFYCDISGLTEEEREAKVQAHLQADAAEPFNKHKPPLMRVGLFTLTAEEHLMLVTLDHAIFDGWSLGIAINGFLESYAAQTRGENAALPRHPSLRDYLSWQEEQDFSVLLAWHRDRLCRTGKQRLPFAVHPPVRERADAAEVVYIQCSKEEDRRITQGAKNLGVTPSVLFYAGWSLLLSCCQEEKSAYFLSVQASRPSSVKDIHAVFNLLLDLFPYSLACPDQENVTSWLKDIHAYQIEALDHTGVPLQDILALGNDLTPPALSSVLVFENMETGESRDEKTTGVLRLRGAGMFCRYGFAMYVMAFPLPCLYMALVYDDSLIARKDVEILGDLLKQAMLTLAEGSERALGDIRASLGISRAFFQRQPVPVGKQGQETEQ